MPDTAPPEEPTPENIRTRFATLGTEVTRAEIAWATFRQPVSVGNWVRVNPDFPPALDRPGRTEYRARDAVAAWYFKQSFAQEDARGRKPGSTAPAVPRREGARPRAAGIDTPTTDQVQAAFSKLPVKVTRAQIAKATRRSPIAVAGWIRLPEFPSPVDPPDGVRDTGAPAQGTDPHYRDRDEVLAWYLRQSFASTERTGPKDTAALALAASADSALLTVPELTIVLGLREKKTLYNWVQAGRPGDPFPPADAAGAREWAAVRSWVLRKDDPLPEGPDPEVQQWVLRHAADADARTVDAHGLPIGRRDVVERARLARAAGRNIPQDWLAAKLGLPVKAVRALLVKSARPPAPARLFPAALARELGVDVKELRALARRFTAGEDPFPPAAQDGHEVAAVRSWLERRGLLPAGNPVN